MNRFQDDAERMALPIRDPSRSSAGFVPVELGDVIAWEESDGTLWVIARYADSPFEWFREAKARGA